MERNPGFGESAHPMRNQVTADEGSAQSCAGGRAIERLGFADDQRRHSSAVCTGNETSVAAVLMDHGAFEDRVGHIDATVYEADLE